MSAANATSKKNSSQPVLTTTGQGAALCVTLGVFLLALGFLWLLSMIADGSEVLRQMRLTLQGLCGPLCPALPLLLIWGGVKLTVSARHRVSARDILLVSCLYLLLLAGYTLMARVPVGTSTPSYVDYLSTVNFAGVPAYRGFSEYLYMAFRDPKTGGLLGMLIAHPLWKLLGRMAALLLVALLMIVLAFVLFRINPGDLFRSASDRKEQRRARREARRQEKERARAEKAAREAAAQPAAPAPPVQQLPLESLRPTQTVQRTETVYMPSDDPSYGVPPRYSTPDDGFYPVPQDLYDERFPLHPAQQTQAPVYPPVSQPAPAPSYTPVQPAPAQVPRQDEAVQEPPVPPRFRRRRYHDTPEPAQQTVSTTAPLQPVKNPPATAVQEQMPIAQPPVQPEEKKTPDRKAEKRSPRAQEAKTNDLPPWEEPDMPGEQKKPANQPAADPKDWSAQVRKKQRELELPPHPASRKEPEPVGIAPAVPLNIEHVPIQPRSPLPESKARVDGTPKTPKPSQMEMNLRQPYQAPPIRLLREGKHIPIENTAQEDEAKAQIIENTLRSFGVESEVKQIMHGPAITRFAIQIAPGVKVSRVSNTADNLALDLKTKHVRVEAPIQGTSFIGIEVPNQLVSTVSLREVLDSPEMNANPSPLLVALGKDIAGAPILCDLSKMPHLLIAGATGSGKSVCINSIICSLLYRTSPEQVRLIMIDPKQVELSVYNAIPHLLVPVVSDPKKAAGALAWVVQEMLERYSKFSALGVRNLAGYNKANQGTDQVLPNIVVIIDEMADLMEVCRKDVEESIRRLAALARAAGIYMVLATQRPSVDVITGVIKNNIPSRIAFAVSSGTDSRTIIDMNGAEKLMGKGDMLYKPTGTSPVRVQGCFVSDEEVNAVANYIAQRYQTDYDPNIVEHLENTGRETAADETTGFDDGNGSVPAGSGGNEAEFSDLLQQAIEMAVEDGQTSTSMLQRRLRVGYARAGRLIDEMEKRGIISQSEGSKPRKTIITREQYYELMQDAEE